MPLPLWVSKYNSEFALGARQTSIVLWVVRRCERPNVEHRLTLQIIKEMFESGADLSEHIAVVFTFCDKHQMTKDFQREWLEEICMPIISLTPKHVFEFDKTTD